MVLALMPMTAFAETSGSTDDGLEYTISDGKVNITGFRGTGTTVTIPSEINGYPVTSIRSQAFEFKKNITNVTFQSPSNVTKIGRSAFGHCSSLRSITLPDSVTAMGKMVFYKCESLTSIIIPGNVKSIHEKAFLGCTGLTSVMIPDSVTSIESEAFSRCTGLTSVTIPDSVTSIERNAFSGCTGLASVTIPDNVKSIESETFLGCTGLASVTIPDSVTVIESRAFSGCTGLTSVTIPDSVKLIEMKAFSGCTNLKSIEIPRSVTSISDYAFEGCTSLESIFLPKDLDITNEKVPDATSQIRYSLDTERGEVTITEIKLGTGKDTVDIPETICGYPVVREVTVPFTTTVEVRGNASPGETTFNLEVVNSQGNELQPNDYNVKITASVETDGAGDYNGNLTFKGTASAILRMFDNERDESGYIYVKQAGVNDSNWDVDEAAWGLFHKSVVDLSDEEVEPSPIYIFPAVKDGTSYSVEDGENGVDKMTFVNKYASSVVDPSDSEGTTNGDSDNDSKADAEDSAKTGDNANLALWLALMILAGAGIAGTTVYTRRKRTNE